MSLSGILTGDPTFKPKMLMGIMMSIFTVNVRHASFVLVTDILLYLPKPTVLEF